MTRVALIADADAYFGLAIVGLMTRKLGFSDVVEVQSFNEAEAYLSSHPEVTVAILSSSTPGLKSVADFRSLRENCPHLKVVVTSASASHREVLSALEARVHGFIPKALTIPELTAALRHILAGSIYVPPSLAELDSSPSTPVQSALTPRQREVLDLLTQGKPNKEIASALSLSEGTVKVHLAAIFRHFGVNNRAAAVGACAPLSKFEATSRPRGFDDTVAPASTGALKRRLGSFPSTSFADPLMIPSSLKRARANSVIARGSLSSGAEFTAANLQPTASRRPPIAIRD